MNIQNSVEAFIEAKKHIPGGVNSPARAFKGVGSNPIFIKSAKGSKIYDIDGNEFIDYVGSWGPMILGHAPKVVVEGLSEVVENGASFGAPTLIETKMAQLVKQLVPSIDQVRMVNSGTEATMSAVRLARGYTARDLVLKFEGCYHGHGDSFLIKAGSGALTLGSPDSPGVTKGTAEGTLLAEYNNIDQVSELFKEHENQIAAVILEPVTGNMGVIKPNDAFVKGIRSLCDEYGTVLIFDEVMTGFRVSISGAQGLLGVQPDLSTFGKVIGGGLPVGVYGGKKEIMDTLAPTGPVYQAGTLSGNPLAMTAGYLTLNDIAAHPSFYDTLESKTKRLCEGFQKNCTSLDIPAVINRVGSMFTVFFTEREKVDCFQDVLSCDTTFFASYFNQMLERGVYFAPSQFEAAFMSIAHSEEDIDNTISKNYESLKALKG